jgi:superfamily II DNA or RNA helicase
MAYAELRTNLIDFPATRKVGKLITVDDVDSFSEVRDYPASIISTHLVQAVSELDEREELEPFLRSILTDVGETPHGPAEIVDILTHKLIYRGKPVMAGFILKGRSFPTVRPKHVAHQIYRLEKIDQLGLALLGYSGTALDQVKEQFCSTAARLGCDYVMLDPVELSRLLVAYGFLCPRDATRIMGGRCTCGYSPTHKVMNILQDEALLELTETRRIDRAAGLVILPPGSGKTRIAAQDAKRASANHILYVAHSHEILDVAQTELEAVFGREAVTRHLAGDSLDSPSKVNLATIQLLREHHAHLLRNAFDYVIIDEFHHAAAPSYRQLLDALDPNFLLGLTATPYRGDRQDIYELCGRNVVIDYDLRHGIEVGVLAPYHYFGCFDSVDYTKIRHNGERYDVRDLERALVIPERDDGIISKWIELAQGKQTLAFCCSHRHAKRFRDRLQERGIAAEVYLSDTPRAKRLQLIEDHRLGIIKILCIVDVLNEGADFPHVDCLLFLRPTESQRIFYQQLGRGLRRYVGKSHCIVIDFIGNFKNAFLISEYQGLTPAHREETSETLRAMRSAREILNLPVGCEVTFDARVVEIFLKQILDPHHATRQNIAKILIYQYQRLYTRLGRKPTKSDVDRNCLLDTRLYRLLWRSWEHFMQVVEQDGYLVRCRVENL